MCGLIFLRRNRAMYHVFGKPFLSLMSNAALTLVQDLGLNKPLHAEVTWHATNPFKPYLPRSVSASKERTKEDRRSILGTYLVISM